VLVPLLAALAKGIGLSPLELALPATLASSLGFMMPAGTPPNALVFASGQLRVADMVRAGLWLDLIGVLVLVLVIGVFL
jgi:sodium-dependent dicarboxylate transporter 2/3/5